MIKAVLFDLDDTLRSFMITKGMACEAAMDAMIEAGLKMDQERALDRLFVLYGKYGIEDKLIFQKFLKDVNGKIDYKILAAGIVAYREAANKRNKPIAGVMAVLKSLKKRKMKLGVVSNAPSLKAWLRLTESGMRDYFDFVVAFNDAGKRKPHPKPFAMAVSQMGTMPDEILFIGDDLKRDVAGAKKLGMKTALADYETRHTPEDVSRFMPDYVLGSPKDILKIIKQNKK
jgi:putative hydrolase of the HAD superfamily